MRAYFIAAKKAGYDSPDQPSNDSGLWELNGKQYVMLHNVNGILAVYRVRNDGLLKRMKSRWPEELEMACHEPLGGEALERYLRTDIKRVD